MKVEEPAPVVSTRPKRKVAKPIYTHNYDMCDSINQGKIITKINGDKGIK